MTNRARAQGLNSRLSLIIFRRLGGGFASAERYLNASSGAVCPLGRRGRLTMKSRRGAGEATWLHADARCMTGTVPDIAHRFTVAFNAGDVRDCSAASPPALYVEDLLCGRFTGRLRVA